MQKENTLIKHVACYCRVSTDEQVRFGFSIQAQKDSLKKYCKENNYKYEFFIDEGISASSMKKRKALIEMLNKSKTFDMILFTKLDRLSRNVLDANNINKLLLDNHCTMKAINEDDIDTSTADGTFLFNLKVSLAQREIEKTSERIKDVFQNKREKGEVTSGTRKYGYNIVNKKFEINEEEAENLRNLYNEFINTNGNLQETYNFFIKNFSGKGYDAMCNYLSDTAYIGKYKLYRKDIYLENYIPAIIDINIWNQVQNLRDKKSVERENKPEDIFAGLLYCSKCGMRLSKKVDYRTKIMRIRYICDNNYRYKVGIDEKRCSNNKTIREDYLEEILLEELKPISEKLLAISKVSQASPQKIDNSVAIQKLKNKIEKLKDLYIDDLIDKTTYKNDYTKYQDKLKELENANNSNDKYSHKKNYEYLYQIINSDYKTIYNQLSIQNKKKFWLSFINKIYIENGNIKEISFL